MWESIQVANIEGMTTKAMEVLVITMKCFTKAMTDIAKIMGPFLEAIWQIWEPVKIGTDIRESWWASSEGA